MLNDTCDDTSDIMKIAHLEIGHPSEGFGGGFSPGRVAETYAAFTSVRSDNFVVR